MDKENIIIFVTAIGGLCVMVLLIGVMSIEQSEPVYDSEYTCEELKELMTIGVKPNIICTYENNFYGHKYNVTGTCTATTYYLENCFGEQQ